MTILSRMRQQCYRPEGYDSADRDSVESPKIRSLLLDCATALWNDALDTVAPLGYEDESGFHYGTRAAEADDWLRPTQACPRRTRIRFRP